MGLFSKKVQENDLQHFLDATAKEWPNEKFIEEDTEINESGQTFIIWWSELKTKYFWFFDSVEIRDFQGIPNKNILFKSRKDFDLRKLKKLVNECAKIKGKDDQGRSKFASEDEKYIKEGYGFTRHWLDNPGHPIILSYDREDGVELSIFYTG